MKDRQQLKLQFLAEREAERHWREPRGCTMKSSRNHQLREEERGREAVQNGTDHDTTEALVLDEKVYWRAKKSLPAG